MHKMLFPAEKWLHGIQAHRVQKVGYTMASTQEGLLGQRDAAIKRLRCCLQTRRGCSRTYQQGQTNRTGLLGPMPAPSSSWGSVMADSDSHMLEVVFQASVHCQAFYIERCSFFVKELLF